jgi:nucleoid-associated protein YgaU
VNPNRLKVGTTLLLPDVADVVPTAAGASSTTAAPVDSKSEYRVQSRDSLYSISVKLYGSPEKMAELYELNKQAIGADPGKLKLNMVLKLPAAPTASASR